MRKYLTISFFLMILLVFSYPAFAITYDFDNVTVLYAANFDVSPVNVEPDSWITQIAGGANNSINVLYGIVDLSKDGVVIITEEFIKVSNVDDVNTFETFLVNSVSYDYYPGTSDYRQISSLFWSGKKINESTNQIIKDYSQPMNAIALVREFDESQNLVGITLNGQYSQGSGSEEEIKTIIGDNTYEADITSITETGDPTAISG